MTKQTQESYAAVFDTNVLGTLLGLKHEMRVMAKQGGGSIVNLSSVLGKVGAPNAAVYTASKHAVEGLTKAAALEGAANGVRVNAVAPGPPAPTSRACRARTRFRALGSPISYAMPPSSAGPINPGAIDMAVVRQRKRDMVAAQVAAHLENYKASGAELVMGSARFVAPKTLEDSLNDGGTRVLAGEKIFINVGTHAAITDVPALAAASPPHAYRGSGSRLSSRVEALDLDYLPEHLIVLGGGYVGLELAQAYRRFGSQVTVIERLPQPMGREDGDVANEIQRILAEEGIEFLLGAEVMEVRGTSGDKVSVVVRAPRPKPPVLARRMCSA